LWKFIVPAVVIAIAIAAVLIFLPEPEIADRGDPPAVQRSEAPPARAPETARPAAPAPSTGESPAKAGDVAVEQDDTLQAPRILPTFDVVRVTRDGNAVIAGRAAPGAQVTVLDKGEPLGTVTADPRGEWVLIPQRQLEPGARELSIQAQGEDDSPVESEQVVVLAVPARVPAGSCRGRVRPSPGANRPAG
jgi:hypothetical protein